MEEDSNEFNDTRGNEAGSKDKATYQWQQTGRKCLSLIILGIISCKKKRWNNR